MEDALLRVRGLRVAFPTAAGEAWALDSYPHKLVFPAVVLCLIVLAFNLISDGLRDAFDPRSGR